MKIGGDRMADYIKREDAIRIARIQGKKAQFDGMVKMSDIAMKYEDWLRGCVHHDGRKGNVYLPCDRVLAIADWIEAHRDVAPVRHGRWEGCKGDITCSACGEYALYDSEDIEMQYRTLYCPFCGAKMDEGE